MWSFIPRTDAAPARNGVGGLIRIAALLLIAALAGCNPGTPPLPTAAITVGTVTVTVEVARTAAERQTGMMHRRKIGPDEGMLFVFPAAETLHFYMKNTHVPLSIAFIRADGTIERIAGMQPHDLTVTSSRAPCLYALEMPQGWFGDHGIWEGARVTLPEGLTASD